jgi:hypothetical protein
VKYQTGGHRITFLRDPGFAGSNLAEIGGFFKGASYEHKYSGRDFKAGDPLSDISDSFYPKNVLTFIDSSLLTSKVIETSCI